MTLRAILIATAASLALATATPADAKPDKDNILAFIAGMAALAILATPPAHPAPQPYHPQPQPQPWPQPRPVPQPPAYHGLPQQCAISIRTKFGWEKVYTEQCLWRAGYGRSLPRQCLARVRGDHGWNEVYAEDCLRQRGY